MGGCDAGMTWVRAAQWTPRWPRGETHPAMVHITSGSSGGCAQDGAVVPPTRHLVTLWPSSRTNAASGPTKILHAFSMGANQAALALCRARDLRLSDGHR